MEPLRTTRLKFRSGTPPGRLSGAVSTNDVSRSLSDIEHGDAQPAGELLPLDDEAPPDNLIDRDDELPRLVVVDHDAAALVKLRDFAGTTFGQAAQVLGIGRRSADRNGAFARAWLFEHFGTANEQREG